MVKNILIVMLLVTNGSTLFYIYQHMSPEKKVTVDTNIVEQLPQYFYRIYLVDGGTAEGRGIVKKKYSVDLIDRGKVTMTIDNSNIRQIDKVYFKTGKTKKIVNRKTYTKSYN